MNCKAVYTLLLAWCYSLTTVETQASVVFRTEPNNPRIYLEATSGTYVCTVNAYDEDSGEKLTQYKLARLPDANYFTIEENSGVISTSERRIEDSVGTVFNLRVYGVLAGSTYDMSISVEVSRQNVYTPVFENAVYTFSVFEDARRSSYIGAVHATDQDIDDYNKNLEYYGVNSSQFIVDKSTGNIFLKEPLPEGAVEFDLTVVVSDRGVPPFYNNISVLIRVTSLPAPNDFCNAFTGEKGTVCWKTPNISDAYDGFKFAYGRDGERLTNSEIVPASLIVRDEACAPVDGAVVGAKYSFYTWTLNGTEKSQRSVGGKFVASPNSESFLLTGENCKAFNVCNLVQPCANGGKCLWSGELQFSCECADGWRGQKCLLQDLCPTKPCFNNGQCVYLSHQTFECRCDESHYGDRCEHADQCLTSPCQNSGSCTKTDDGSFYCNCTESYSGHTCDVFDPCLTNPCVRGTCLREASSDSGYICQCPEGYNGSRCQYSNQCIVNSGICQNGGTCFSLVNSYYLCLCPEEYTGKNCESFNTCVLDICQNNSTCSFVSNNKYKCSCISGFYGQECQHYNLCADKPCLNGATCRNTTDSFTCECLGGFYDRLCDRHDPCFENPCERGGICTAISDWDYNCTCSPETFGKNCSYVNSCKLEFCKNGATCENTTLDGSFTCHCPVGYYDRYCTKYDPCVSSPCENGGTCNNVSSQEFSCSCPLGFTGILCETQLPCFSSPCRNGGKCSEGGAHYTCTCTTGFTGNTCADEVLCPSERTQGVSGSYAWPSTGYRGWALLPCALGPRGQYAKRRCGATDDGVKWESPETSNCTSKDEGYATEQLKMLKSLTSDPANMGPDDVANVATVLEFVFEFSLRNKQIANDLTEVVSNVMDARESVLKISQSRNSSSQRMVGLIGNFTAQAEVVEGSNVTLSTKNIHVVALDTSENVSDITFSPAFLDTNNMSMETDATIVIPSSIIQDNSSDGQRSVQRLEFAAFNTAKFFLDEYTEESTDTIVISASLTGRQIDNLSEPVIIHFPEASPHRNYTCRFWNETGGYWSTEGVDTVPTIDNYTECHTYHLTSFAILMDPSPDYRVAAIHNIIQTYITYIGCGISMLGLTITIITYGLFKCLHGDKSGKILLNLCVSMLMLNIVFVLGSQKGSHYGREICMTVAILIHYFLLTTLMWMCIEAGNMYRVLVTVFTKYTDYFMLKRCIIAWGIPAIIVGITMGVSLSNYETQDEFCFISHASTTAFYVAVLAPACVIILIDIVVFVMVSRVIMKPRFTGHINAVDTTITAAQVRGAFTVLVLLGVSWVFGPLAINEAKLVFSYLFCIANAFQGFLIFIFRCFINPEARAAWLQLIRTGTFKRRRGPTVPTTTSSASRGESKGNGALDDSKRNTMVLNGNVWHTDKYIQRSHWDTANGCEHETLNGHSNGHSNGHNKKHLNEKYNGVNHNSSTKSRFSKKDFTQL
ncbi:uncharacterized protein LOC135471789 isoform X2 [Liolophura sinensis]|uniref:uncharacterized protein LOC135471789 isoform X2 n=1 Tax=Liolophura sinensis TaxID=3198878 RepID=UPI0031582106